MDTNQTLDTIEHKQVTGKLGGYSEMGGWSWVVARICLLGAGWLLGSLCLELGGCSDLFAWSWLVARSWVVARICLLGAGWLLGDGWLLGPGWLLGGGWLL